MVYTAHVMYNLVDFVQQNTLFVYSLRAHTVGEGPPVFSPRFESIQPQQVSMKYPHYIRTAAAGVPFSKPQAASRRRLKLTEHGDEQS